MIKLANTITTVAQHTMDTVYTRHLLFRVLNFFDVSTVEEIVVVIKLSAFCVVLVVTIGPKPESQ